MGWRNLLVHDEFPSVVGAGKEEMVFLLKPHCGGIGTRHDCDEPGSRHLRCSRPTRNEIHQVASTSQVFAA